MPKFIITVLIFYACCTLYGQNIQLSAKIKDHLSMNAGMGTVYGSITHPGVGLEYPFYRFVTCGLSLFGGIGYDTDIPVYASAIRLCLGTQDRIVADVVYGVTEYDIEEGYVDGEKIFSEKTLNYGPSLMFGYQRVTENGFVFSTGFGLSYNRCKEVIPALYISFGLMVL